jgi:transcriptional regulator with XRE-family HTH domain
MLAQLIDVPMFPAQRQLMLRGIQIRMARAALRWSAQELANRARLGIATVQRAERLGIDVPAITAANLFAIQRAFEGAGITFIDDGEESRSGGPGLRLPQGGEKP